MAGGVGLGEVGGRPLGKPDLARVVVADALQLLDLLGLERGHGDHLDAVSKLAAGVAVQVSRRDVCVCVDGGDLVNKLDATARLAHKRAKVDHCCDSALWCNTEERGDGSKTHKNPKKNAEGQTLAVQSMHFLLPGSWISSRRMRWLRSSCFSDMHKENKKKHTHKNTTNKREEEEKTNQSINKVLQL